jgi:uncharacterized membrane protein
MSAKKNNMNLFAAVGATVIGVVAGVAGMFLSDKGNREKVANEVKKVVRKGKAKVSKVKTQVAKTKKKVLKRVKR